MANSRPEADACTFLDTDHKAVKKLFKAYEELTHSKARDVDQKKRELAQEICQELTVHATIEEEIFYPAVKGEVEDDMLDEAYVEHDGAKVLIAEIEAGGPDDEFYDAKVKVLSEMIEHHVKEEEQRVEGMFSQARAAGLDMDALADAMRARGPRAVVVTIPGCGHAPALNTPAQFALVERFFNG